MGLLDEYQLSFITFFPLATGVGLLATSALASLRGSAGLPAPLWRAVALGSTTLTFLLSLRLFTAFYPTRTKEPRGRPDPQLLTYWRAATTVPAVAIGGIKVENCAPLVRAGADFLAVVTAIWDHPDGPAVAVAAFDKAIAEALAG